VKREKFVRITFSDNSHNFIVGWGGETVIKAGKRPRQREERKKHLIDLFFVIV
jgi:hypothetical protein